jgi:hypothetical protein
VSPKNAIAAGNEHRSLRVNFSACQARKMHVPFTKIATVALVSLTLAAGTAAAQEMPKDQVQDRVPDTDQRINQEYREGNISRGQAHELKQENRETSRKAR